jgi:TolB-like protein/DNA-binding winged helix-turn-helix (wHTH) protein/tetratricopeptide (TPR) repeat protein
LKFARNGTILASPSMSTAPRAFRFGDFTLDLTRGALCAGDRPVELRPKSFGVLAHLVENAGRLVPKDELMQAVWPDVVVSDESLAKCVSEARAALGDAEQRLVKTVPRRGYLFDAPVSPANGWPAPLALTSALDPPHGQGVGSHEVARPAAVSRRRHAVIAGTLLLTAVAVIALAVPWGRPAGPPLPARPSIAVLPFSGRDDPQQDYFGDGLTEDLTTSLGRFRELFVIGHDSTLVYKRRDAPPAQIGRELGVRYLLEGSVRRDGDRVRITARLLDAATGREIWGESYDRALTGIFAVQDDLTRNIVTSLVAHVDHAELERGARTSTASPAAYDLYLRGRALITMRHGDNRGEMVFGARRLFEQALAIDPGFAPAVQGLAYTYAAAFLEPMRDGQLSDELRQPGTIGHALMLARRAVELDPYLAEAHATLAWILHWQYRRGEALAEFERALELNPNLADGRLGHLLVHDGRAREAVAYLQRVMRQDPFPPPIYLSYLGNAYYMTGQYDAAYDTLRSGRERLPDYRALSVWLAAAAAQSGRVAEARRAAQQILSAAPNFTISGWLGHIQFERQSDAERLAEGLRKAGLPS